ncbi:unnamed protein product [Schistosoma rodhaini]|nr:unnamed protein product [Schistosoma rodhaini]
MTLDAQDEYKMKKEDIELYKRIRREVEQEFMAKSEPVDYRSVTKVDFHKDVVRLSPRPEPMLHEMVREQPVTFWTEHRDKMHFRLKPIKVVVGWNQCETLDLGFVLSCTRQQGLLLAVPGHYQGNTHYSTNRTTPFGRNAAFTTPIGQYLNSRMPCEMQVFSR